MPPGCTNYYYSNKDVHYHWLPLVDADRLRKWLQVLKRNNLPDTAFARVCSDHFIDSDYEFKGMFRDGAYSRQQTSNLTAVACCPSKLNLTSYSLSMTHRPTSSNTNLDREREFRRRKREANSGEFGYLGVQM